jgi:F0F1-type ATP synthase assembly protein I
MVIPSLLGYWLDQRFGTSPGLVLAGLALGMWFGIKSLVRLTSGQHGGDQAKAKTLSDKDSDER